MNHTSKQTKKSRWQILGEHYGYPKCCIASFEQTMGAIGNPLGAEAGEETGFIPCPSCAKLIINQEIKLGDLIINRKHSLPFPNSSTRVVSRELNISM